MYCRRPTLREGVGACGFFSVNREAHGSGKDRELLQGCGLTPYQ